MSKEVKVHKEQFFEELNPLGLNHGALDGGICIFLRKYEMIIGTIFSLGSVYLFLFNEMISGGGRK